jgi:hypothetical protein
VSTDQTTMTNPLNSVNLKKSKNLPKFQTMCSWYIKLQVHFKPLGVAVFSLLPISMHQYIRRDDAFEETSRDQGIYFIRFCLGGMNYIRGPATQSPPLIIFAFLKKKMATKSNSRTRSASSSSTSPPAKRQKITVAPFAATFPRRTLLSSSRWVNKVPHDIWVYKIFQPFLDLKALSTLGRCNTFFEEFWQYVLKQNVIRVPEGCPTLDQAMDLAVIFSERNECTREDPVRVVVGDGEHEMVGVTARVTPPTVYYGSLTHVSCNNITIVGKGKGKTTLLGGFCVNDKQNVKMEQLAVTNTAGCGLLCKGSGTNVDVTECCFKKCQTNGMLVEKGATATATRCDFMENGESGVACFDANTKVRLNDSTIRHNGYQGLSTYDRAVVDLHGTKTYIHSNKQDGISATENAKVNIHLPTQHNTSHDNVRQNRYQDTGGSIANINADGTFTHVEEVENDDDY